MAANNKYQMVISRQTIDKLGIKLYDRVSAVLAELIANAYDADATFVRIFAPLGVYLTSKTSDFHEQDQQYTIIIEDNGHGMTAEEVNEFYLKVGTDRRRDSRRGSLSRVRQRKVMGRKGIGKLAPFGICKEIEIITAGGDPIPGEGYVVSNFIMKLDGILEESIEPYAPIPGELDDTRSSLTGTKIILRNFAHRFVPDKESLHRQLAARFGLSRSEWEVEVHDTLTKDSFFVGELQIDILDDTRIDLENRPIVLDNQRILPITGWVAYAKTSYRDEVMAGIRIYSRGKIVAQTRDFDIPSGFTGEYKMRSYLVGVVHADWLDEEEDLIRSDRQDILWNTEYGQALQQWGRSLISELAARAETSIQRRTWDEFLDISQLRDRLEAEFPNTAELKSSVMDAAKVLLKGVDRDLLRNQDFIDSVVNLAFALGPHRTLLNKLREAAEASNSPFGTVVELFRSARIAEAYSLGQIAYERVKSVERLETLIHTAGTDELELQHLIESAPWLIAPDWTPLSANQSLNRFRMAFEKWYTLEHDKPITTTAIGCSSMRPDFILINLRGELHIVEIKEPSHTLHDDEFKRIINYNDAITSFLEQNPAYRQDFPNVVVTLICDKVSLQETVNKQLLAALERDGALVRRTWIEFLRSTQQAHEDFLETVRQSGEINT
ncbi:hypothetical protein TPY_2179 [Sulfobacillus acidophilus TPY]|uniref:ATP-binding protein n=1 Tax=Sulfobacillus acidophilus (strain ATCC 700253 / DSM 10332 / NAL) TaxID=679936 RepID=G8TZ92_SULAD|nr:hypothetical protein TPY_2179 [Sulfobacillus acidophilus TPY]AEW04061.1 hypothetical protein Sulac_0520 [Sulfobacillus acidophilus DSM 10332]